MKIEINVTESFKRAARPLMKKYSSFVDDLAQLETDLTNDPAGGTSLGQGVYKIRLRIRSKGKGKSGGARVISLLERDESGTGRSKTIIVNLLTVYDKSEKGEISDRELKALIKNLRFDSE